MTDDALNCTELAPALEAELENANLYMLYFLGQKLKTCMKFESECG